MPYSAKPTDRPALTQRIHSWWIDRTDHDGELTIRHYSEWVTDRKNYARRRSIGCCSAVNEWTCNASATIENWFGVVYSTGNVLNVRHSFSSRGRSRGTGGQVPKCEAEGHCYRSPNFLLVTYLVLCIMLRCLSSLLRSKRTWKHFYSVNLIRRFDLTRV